MTTSRHRLLRTLVLGALLAVGATAQAGWHGRPPVIVRPFGVPCAPGFQPYPVPYGPYAPYVPYGYGYGYGYPGWVAYDPRARLVPGFAHPGWRGHGDWDEPPRVHGYTLR